MSTTQQTPNDQDMAERIRQYIETKLPNASDLRLEAMERIAVGDHQQSRGRLHAERTATFGLS